MRSIIESIAIPFLTIAIAELGDKTQISILLLSSKTNKHFQLLCGVLLAFFIVDGIAILAGAWITTIIPTNVLKIASGIIFILFGLLMLLKKDKDEGGKVYDKNIFLSGFLLVMLTEWGDKTQIAAALFASNYEPFFVLIGTMVALLLLSALAVFFGKFISERVDENIITKIGGLIFIILGLFFFF